MENELEAKFLQLLQENASAGINDEIVRAKIPGITLHQIAQIVNSLSKKSLLDLFKGSNPTGEDCLWYKLSSSVNQGSTASSDAQSVWSTLDTDEKMVYQVIKNAHNKGAWTKDIKVRTGLHQNVLTKLLKNLETKKIIKAVKAKNSTRKVFMLMEVEPSLEITGGPWFTENELDSQFIEGIAKACYKFIASRSFPSNTSLAVPDALFPATYTGYATISQIHSFVTASGITNIQMSLEDIENVLKTLIYDGKIEKVAISHELVTKGTGGSLQNASYRIDKSSNFHFENHLAATPCGVCPVINQCKEVGPITPEKCEYFRQWLSNFTN